MLNNAITTLKNTWLQSDDCNVRNLLDTIKKTNKLRTPQIEAIETYLFLKIKGENKPLWQLFSEGFFIVNKSDDLFNNWLKERSIQAYALYDFAETENLTPLTESIRRQYNSVDCEDIIKKMFYGVSYSDYLMSLPMGAGKTYLMASFIYLDLYFALKEHNNQNFAHNFLILIPSALKNSILPSLKNISTFDGAWVLPKEHAKKIKNLIKFDVLDESKSMKKSNLTVNPNATKVNNILPNPIGQIFVVNAEKVILEQNRDDLIKGAVKNELKEILAKVPNMSIFIDEVHHASDSDIKLRETVTWWNKKGNITSVLGFSGTPYLQKRDSLQINGGRPIKFSYITNTVYYYSLTKGIESFLKRPTVKSANLEKTQILKEAITDFNKKYKDTVYADGTIAKCAVYCSNIIDLEEVVYPYLVEELNISDDEILKFHRGNQKYSIPSQNQLEFNMLDSSGSRKRYILLVQVGKEGWDCHSLTSVILSGAGDSPKNMILQTSCRCLREVDAKDNTALIWLNENNAKILDQQLAIEQKTSIDDINKLNRGKQELIKRESRIENLKLPKVSFYQLIIEYTDKPNIEQTADTKTKLKAIAVNLSDYKKTAVTTTSNLVDNNRSQVIVDNLPGYFLSFNNWLAVLVKNSFNHLFLSDFDPFTLVLQQIYQGITANNYFNELYDLAKINNDIALAFSINRTLSSKTDTIEKSATILLVDKLTGVEEHPKLYPNPSIVKQILEADVGKTYEGKQAPIKQEIQEIQELITQGKYEEIIKLATLAAAQSKNGLEFKNRDKTFHYLPYDFGQSAFEEKTLTQILKLSNFQNSDLEVYYNGARGLTDFVINCYEQTDSNYRMVGKYTPDFLIIKRNSNDNSIHKILILETKGRGFASEENFTKRKEFINNEFIRDNNKKFGYPKFDFLYLQDDADEGQIIKTLEKKITRFFEEKGNAN